MASPHIIQKVVLDYAFAGKAADAEKRYNAARENFYTNVLPAMEEVLQAAGFMDTIVVEKLELTLGQTSLANLPDLLAAHLQSALQIVDGKGVVPTPAGQLQTKAAALLFFFSRGCYPVHFDGPEASILLDEILAADAFFWEKLIPLLVAQPAAQRRFMEQAYLHQHNGLIAYLITSSPIKTVIAGWQKIIAAGKGKTASAAKQLLSFLLQQHRQKNVADGVKRFVETLVQPYFHRPVSDALVVEEKLLAAIINNEPASVVTALQPLPFIKQKTAIIKPAPEQAIAESESLSPEETELLPHEAISTTTAGLVLLHPFLAPFFTELTLMKNNVFLNPATQRKAVQVLYYLATGSTKTPEHLLPLAKLLCGLPVHQPVAKTLRLTAAEKGLCATLLSSVLHHWKPLSGTSVAGLQTSFIQRAGLLKKQDADWVLHVDKKPYDILLPDLPWQYSFIQAPWATYFIHVQW